MLYEVAILEKPTKKQLEEHGSSEKLILGPKPVCASNEQAAVVMVMRGNLQGKEFPDVDPNRLEVLVRPFGAKKH